VGFRASLRICSISGWQTERGLAVWNEEQTDERRRHGSVKRTYIRGYRALSVDRSADDLTVCSEDNHVANPYPVCGLCDRNMCIGISIWIASVLARFKRHHL
jgi:hypothetical protein